MPTVSYGWTSVSSGIYVNTQEIGAQDQVAVTPLNGGTSYLVTWYDPNDSSIQARIIGANGTPLTAQFAVNTTNSGTQTQPSAVQLANGNILITFTDYSVDAGGDIRGRLFNSSGVAIGNDFAVSTGGSDDSDSDLAALPDGGYVVSYSRDFGGNDLDVLFQVFNADGSPRVGNNTDTSTALSSSNSQIVALSNNNFVVVYEQAPVAGGDSEVVYRLYNSAGTAITGATIIDTTGTINNDIQVIALPDGGFAVAYADNGWAIDQTEITLRLYNADGSARTSYIQANNLTVGAQVEPTLTLLSNGSIAVGWTSGDSVYMRAFDIYGQPLADSETFISLIDEAEFVYLSDGRIAVTRSSQQTDAGGDQSIRTTTFALERVTIGDASAEYLVGDSLRDSIDGAGGNDVIIGGLGVDTLTGGLGNDLFRDTAAGFNGDTITDFGTGDRILLTDANLSSFSYLLNGNTLTYSGGSLTLQNIVGYKVVATAAAEGGVQLNLVRDVENDYNGDGRSDVLFRYTDGTIMDWLGQPNGSLADNYANSGYLNNTWTLLGNGDFNGDGREDLVFRSSTTNLIMDWLGNSNGGFVNNYANAAFLDPSWTMIGVGDVNSDGRDDLIFRSTNGLIMDWLGQADGSFVNNYANASFVDSSFQVLATGDFNGDNREDIVFRNSGGIVFDVLGQSNGSFVNNYGNAGYLDASWTLLGVGDVNGDGRDDLILRNTGGTVMNWLGQANGSFTNTYATSQYLDATWSFAGVGDFNGDGRDDILWRQNTGLIMDWLGQADGSYVNNYAVAGYLDNTWTVRDIADYNGDGRDDILLRQNGGLIMDWLGQPNGSFVNNYANAGYLDNGWTIQGPSLL